MGDLFCGPNGPKPIRRLNRKIPTAAAPVKHRSQNDFCKPTFAVGVLTTRQSPPLNGRIAAAHRELEMAGLKRIGLRQTMKAAPGATVAQLVESFG
jgi:hypothetical protein